MFSVGDRHGLQRSRGVIPEQIGHAGRWGNRGQMEGCYLTNLPMIFMRRMAGHPEQQGCFEIQRDTIQPPAELMSMIWPELDKWSPEALVEVDDLAAEGFCELLRHLRVVILQDSVALREAFPAHPIWDHPVFHHAAYQSFAAQMKEHGYLNEDGSTSYTTWLVQTVPEIADSLQSIKSQVNTGFRDQKLKLDSIETKTESGARQALMQQTHDTIQYCFTNWVSGNVNFHLPMPTPPPELVAMAAATAATASTVAAATSAAAGHGAAAAAPAATATPVTVPITPLLPASAPALSPAAPPAPAPALPPSPLSSVSQSPPQDQRHAAVIGVPQTPPQYKMNRDMHTVEGLYH